MTINELQDKCVAFMCKSRGYDFDASKFTMEITPELEGKKFKLTFNNCIYFAVTDLAQKHDTRQKDGFEIVS